MSHVSTLYIAAGLLARFVPLTRERHVQLVEDLLTSARARPGLEGEALAVAAVVLAAAGDSTEPGGVGKDEVKGV